MTDASADQNQQGPAGLNEQEYTGLEALFPHASLRIEAVEIVRRAGDHCDALLEVIYDERRAAGGKAGGRLQTIRQTVAYFHRPTHALPAFSLTPTQGLTGGLVRQAARLSGMPVVELPAYPDFTKEFSILSFQPKSTRKLFQRPVMDAFIQYPDYRVTTGPGQIAVFRHNHVESAENRSRLLEAGRFLTDRLFRAAAEMPSSGMTADQEALQTIKGMTGLLGNQLRSSLVTKSQADEFLAQTTPRKVPQNIGRLAYGGTGFMMLWGGIILIGGGSFLFAFIALGADGSIALPVMLSLLPLIGGLVLFFSARRRWRIRRMLRHGIIQSARVLEVKVSNTQIGEDRQHDVTFETGSGRVVIRMGRVPAARARDRLKDGEPAHILTDPSGPTRGVWVEGWGVDIPR